MLTEPNDYLAERPSLLAAARKYWWVTLVLTLSVGGVGFLPDLQPPTEWIATASIVVEDPQASTVFETAGLQRPDRYVENQVAIIRSVAVANRASEIASEEDPAVGLTDGELLDRIEISSSSTSDVLTVEFQDEDPHVALTVVNSFGAAYLEVRREEAVRGFLAPLERLDVLIAEEESMIQSLQHDIDRLVSAGPLNDELDRQFGDALARLIVLHDELQASAETALDDEAVDNIEAEIARIVQELQALRLLQEIEGQDSEVARLSMEQTDAIERLSSLVDRRQLLEVDAELAGGSVVFFDPAEFAQLVESLSVETTVPLLAILGALIGITISYFIAARTKTFSSRIEPEPVLGVPLIAEVPRFGAEKIKSYLPIVDEPHSTAAESFRFISAAIGLRLQPGSTKAVEGQTHRRAGRSVIVLSALPGEGKTVVTLNVALAAAREGMRVLAIDADFGDQALAHLLLPRSGKPPLGMTDVVVGSANLEQAVEEIRFGGSPPLHLLARGDQPVSPLSFFQSGGASSLFLSARDFYDLVLIDSPSLLQVAYTTNLLHYADLAMVVVPHGSRVPVLEELRQRVDFIGTQLIGYVYNWAPLRRRLVGSQDPQKSPSSRSKNADSKDGVLDASTSR